MPEIFKNFLFFDLIYYNKRRYTMSFDLKKEHKAICDLPTSPTIIVNTNISAFRFENFKLRIYGEFSFKSCV